jgi:hypothetical protein
MTTSTSTKLSVFILVMITFTGIAFGSHYYTHQQQGYSVTGDTGFSMPEYETQTELVTQLLAPFLLITIILQTGFERALRFAFADDDDPTLLDLTEDRRPPGIKRKSMVMALAVTGMLVPTPFFQYINKLVAWVFGGSIYFLGIVAGLYFAYKLVTSLW